MCDKRETNSKDEDNESCTTEEETCSEDEDDDNRITIRAKWSLDGCASVDEIIERLHQNIAYFQKVKEEGWELEDPICFIVAALSS